MKATLIKYSILLILATILMCGTLLLFGCNDSSSTSPTDPDVVRQPTGDVETFWDSFDWDELTQVEQTLWAVLGWDEASWNGTSDAPASEDKDWSELTSEEQAAATQLGYTQAYWDSLP